MTRPRLSDVPTATAAAVWVLTARYVLARGGFPRAMRHYGLLPTVDLPRPAVRLSPALLRSARVAERVVRMRIFGATCLPRSIAIARVLADRGARADIVLGVTKADGFGAHAWVEAGGKRIDPARFPPGVYQPAGRFTYAK